MIELMYTGKITLVEKMYSQADNGDVLKVDLSIFDGDQEEAIEVRSLAFPLETTKKELQAELVKFVENYNAEKEMAIKNAEYDRLQSQADETIEALTGAEISVNIKGKEQENA